jgi:membrane-associated phospholipid phosphatase
LNDVKNLPVKDMPGWLVVFVALRDGSLSSFALLHMTGIVTFPSFHTALAIVLIYVHRPPLPSFVPLMILNVVMLVAIPFAGHHYLVDMIAGAGVAAISIAIVRLAIRPSLSEDSVSAVAATS